jgi:large subunit ribosomal protein L9
MDMVQLLLTQTVEKLGEPGDLVNVAPGYARNYLLPKGLAVEPTPHNLQRFKATRERRLLEMQEREARARTLQQMLNGTVLTFSRKAHDQKLYSSVRPEEIAARLSEQFRTEITKGDVRIDAPIESLGRHPVTIELYKDIRAEIRVEVVEEPQTSSAP